MTVTGEFTGDFADWRDYTVTISPFTSYDTYGGPTYGIGVSTKCYIEMSPKLVRNSAGQEVVSSARVYVIWSSSYSVLDKVVLPDGKYPPVLRIDDFYNDKSTLELTVLYL
jgi:hypothetical protein